MAEHRLEAEDNLWPRWLDLQYTFICNDRRSNQIFLSPSRAWRDRVRRLLEDLWWAFWS